MKVRWAIAIVCVLLAGMTWVRAAEEKSADKEKKPSARLFAPWSKMTTLKDDQKEKIKEIHGKVLAEIKAIHEKEEADIMALLTAEQKKEVTELMEKEAAEKKAAKKEPADAK